MDIVPEKVAQSNAKKSPIQDDYIEKYPAEGEQSRCNDDYQEYDSGRLYGERQTEVRH